MQRKNAGLAFLLLILVGLGSFFALLAGSRPERAWQAVLINFLLWSAISQGGLMFSVIMHLSRAKWSRGLSGISEGFVLFFPFSLLCYLLLFAGSAYVFPWLHHSLEGKEVWLNLPFLFTRDVAGLLLLYGLGTGYVYYAMKGRFGKKADEKGGATAGKVRVWLDRKWIIQGVEADLHCRRSKSVFAVLYAISFAVVVSLISYDLVMSANPHFISTLFGAYSFIKAIYVGLGALIILLSVLYVVTKGDIGIKKKQFHDIGKLFFGFCLLWGDFFYCQLVVIWYGNIPEETHYLIARTMVSPWQELAWFVFITCFILPFLILINRAIKTRPGAMTVLCAVVIMGIWLEHLLLLGPELNPGAKTLPLGFPDGLIFLGFFGVMALCLMLFFHIFPELIGNRQKEAD